MAVLYTEFDKSNWVYQPSYVRWNHAHRAPRRSLRFNQEIGMMYADLNNIFNKMNSVIDQYDTIQDVLLDGEDFDGISVDWEAEEPATLATVPLSISGLHDMAVRVERLRNRVRDAEDN